MDSSGRSPEEALVRDKHLFIAPANHLFDEGEKGCRWEKP